MCIASLRCQLQMIMMVVIHYVHSVLIEYSSCAYMDSVPCFTQFSGSYYSLGFYKGPYVEKIFLCLFSIRFIMFMFFNIFHGFLGSTCKL